MTTQIETGERDIVLLEDAHIRPMMGLDILEPLPSRTIPYTQVDPFILVHEGVYDDVMSETVKALEAMKVADPADGDDVDMGPVISREQQERVLGFLGRAVDAKATFSKTVRCGKSA